MAQDSAQEKTEDATPKRLREARKKGDVAKSKDLNMVFVMITMFAAIALLSGYMAGEIKEFMRFTYGHIANPPILGYEMMEIGKAGFLTLIKVLGPLMIAGLAAALFIGMLQVGAVFSPEPLKPKFEKLNPIEGFKNMFKAVTFIELLKNLAKLTIVITIAYQTINQFKQEVLLSLQVSLIESVKMTGEIVYAFFLKVMLVFFVIALIDMGVQRWNYLKRHRMSKDEVKREYKQDEGDPQIKGERRRLHREMVFGGGDVKKSVKAADAVIRNPTHVAVAIKYTRADMAAPEVVAKGQKKFAEYILTLAREFNVPVVTNIPLAWSLLQVSEGEAIPEDLYEPVAEVLSFVYEMKEKEGRVSQEKEAAPAEKTEFKPFDPIA